MSKPEKNQTFLISLTPGIGARFDIYSGIQSFSLYVTCSGCCCFDVQTGSKVVCFVFLEYRRCSRSSSKCFLCSAGCCHRNQTQSLFWCETDFQPRPVSHTVLQPFVWRPLWVCCARRSRWADSSVMVIASGNPPCCLARQALDGAALHQPQSGKTITLFCCY